MIDADWCNGSTADSDSVCGSSNLSSPANEKSRKIQCLCGFPALDLFDDRFAPGALQRFFRGFLSSGCRQVCRVYLIAEIRSFLESSA